MLYSYENEVSRGKTPLQSLVKRVGFKRRHIE